MSKWVPAASLIGLICVMMIPAPGVLGIAIGGFCILAIAASAARMVFERFLTRVVIPFLDAIRRWLKPKRGYLHAGSGMARKR